MDIHFCDLCGARVTDVDLRGGHGICRQYDVICATCVELGHGKEWLSASQQRQQQRSAIGSSQPAPAVATQAPVAVADVITAENVINTANDRASTLEDGQESDSVAPQVVDVDESATNTTDVDDVIEETPLADAVEDELPEENNSKDDNDDEGESHLEKSNGTLEADLTPEPAPILNNQFASAASSFSAMGQQSSKKSSDYDVDGEDQGEGLNDESTAAPILADDNDDKASSPFVFEEKAAPLAEDLQSQKDETLPSTREPLMAEKTKSSSSTVPAAKKAATGSASFKRSNGGKSSSSNQRAPSSKSSKVGPKSSARASRAKNKNKNILMLSLISCGILFMVGLIVMSGMKKPPREQETSEVNLSQDVKDAIREAKSSARMALQSKDVKALKEARIKIQAIVPKIYTFGDEAKKHNWTDEQMGQYLDNVGWPDTNMLLRNINDEIIKQGK